MVGSYRIRDRGGIGSHAPKVTCLNSSGEPREHQEQLLA